MLMLVKVLLSNPNPSTYPRRIFARPPSAPAVQDAKPISAALQHQRRPANVRHPCLFLEPCSDQYCSRAQSFVPLALPRLRARPNRPPVTTSLVGNSMSSGQRFASPLALRLEVRSAKPQLALHAFLPEHQCQLKACLREPFLRLLRATLSPFRRSAK